MELQISTDYFPLVVLKVPEQPVEAVIDRGYEALKTFAAGGQFAVIVDLSMVNPMHATPALRAYLYDAVNKLNGVVGDQIVAEAIVIRNDVIRVIYQTYNWMVAKPPRPRRTFRDIVAAKQWCEQMLPNESASS